MNAYISFSSSSLFFLCQMSSLKMVVGLCPKIFMDMQEQRSLERNGNLNPSQVIFKNFFIVYKKNSLFGSV